MLRNFETKTQVYKRTNYIENRFETTTSCLTLGILARPDDISFSRDLTISHLSVRARALPVGDNELWWFGVGAFQWGAGQLGPKTTRTRPLGPIKSRTRTTRLSSRDNSAQFRRQLGPKENSIFEAIFGIYPTSIKYCLSGQWLDHDLVGYICHYIIYHGQKDFFIKILYFT